MGKGDTATRETESRLKRKAKEEDHGEMERGLGVDLAGPCAFSNHSNR